MRAPTTAKGPTGSPSQWEQIVAASDEAREYVSSLSREQKAELERAARTAMKGSRSASAAICRP
jgi:hypothetical protein